MVSATARRAVSVPASIPAPVGGWNGRDSLGDMDAKDAVYMTNWRPLTTECELRYGYSKWSTGYPAQVETIFAYSGATDKLFGVSNGSIYDATAGGAIGAALVSGMANSRFQYVNMATAAGYFLLAVNGSNKMLYYDGTTWSADGGTYTVTVADTSLWIGLTLFKQRVWGVEGGSLKAWYLPTGAIQGAATLFDLSPFFQLGGVLKAVATWTIDAGQGVDDYLVFVSSKGEILVYQGTDPASASTFAMRGLWRVGTPIGNRCLYKWAGDLLYICQDGVLPLSGALQSSRVNPRVALTNKIQQPTSEAISSYGSNFGWQLLNFPKENMLFLNVPIAVGTQQQYVMNTISGAWCNFTGWAANCWEIYKDSPYFGGDTYIGKAWDTNADSGTNIAGSALQAFSYFGSAGYQKRYTMCRPVFRSNGNPSASVAVNTDFDLSDNTAKVSYSPTTSGATFGSAIFGISTFGTGALMIVKNWQGATGLGYCAAPNVKAVSQGIDVRWVSTDILMERGTVL